MSQLTLEIDDELLARAKELAEANKMTVEAMLLRLIRVWAQGPLTPSEMAPNLRRALGMAPPMTDKEVEQAIDEARMEKYGRA
jgi:hypothetical protein